MCDLVFVEESKYIYACMCVYACKSYAGFLLNMYVFIHVSACVCGACARVLTGLSTYGNKAFTLKTILR